MCLIYRNRIKISLPWRFRNHTHQEEKEQRQNGTQKSQIRPIKPESENITQHNPTIAKSSR